MAESGHVVIVGATGAIGGTLAGELAGRGQRLTLVGRDSGKLERLLDELPGDHRSEVASAEEPEALEAAVGRAVEAGGGLDGVVNCIGTVLLKAAHLTSLEEFRETLQLNLVSCFAILRAAVKPMMRSGGGIVFVSSAAARAGLANHEAIAAAKAGVAGLARSAAATYARHGIRVNAVAPGLVETPLTERITGNARAREASLGMHALGRFGQPADVAGLIAYLLSETGSWITGQHIGVDGGLADVVSRQG